MTEIETKKILAILDSAYANFVSGREITSLVNIWNVSLREYDYITVESAVFEVIKTHKGFPPDVATVIAKINEMSADRSPEELWYTLKQALHNGIYGYKEEYAKLPITVQHWLGDASRLREYALMDEETLNSVTHGQFLKGIVIENNRQKYRDALPANKRFEALLKGELQ